MEKINYLAFGGAGYVSSIVESDIIKTEFDYNSLISAITQISIAIVTIVMLFKKRKNNINP